ncbi:hypothetical protein VTL71DRAFT_349 [Oculimacula yallundae]|uniref:Uncharacterized protein n=1 Tax=Oculimacula yallundae TaxID=86028 RepID=A0ABR4D229_9HELO
MLSKYALLQSLFYSLGASRTVQLPNNITVSFFPQDDELACQANNISNAITLTSNSLAPSYFTCFNLNDLFTQGPSNTTYQGILPPGNITRIEYALRNGASFDTNTNYTRVWYDLAGSGSESEEEPAVMGSHTFYSYAFPDCMRKDHPLNVKDNPWFSTNCQSRSGGECKSVPHTIRSFAILAASGNASESRECEKSGSAPASGHSSSIAVAVAAAAALFLVL